MPFNIIKADITTLDTDAIVNAANGQLLAGGGVCGAIFAAAGRDEMQAECNKIGHCDIGGAVITKGFKLKAKYVIHTVGPIYGQDPANEEEQLYSCYKNSLELARENDIESITFPLISSGIYGYPKKEALDIAIKAIRDFLEDNEMDIYLAIYNNDDLQVDEKLKAEIEEYIEKRKVLKNLDSYVVRLKDEFFNADYDKIRIQISEPNEKNYYKEVQSLDEIVNEKKETFSRMLLRLIDEKGLTDSEAYKRANVDRRVFSKIRQPDYVPTKNIILAFVIALKLDMNEARALLGRAGYAFSECSSTDLVVEFFIEQKMYDIDRVNAMLFHYNQPILGSKAREEKN